MLPLIFPAIAILGFIVHALVSRDRTPLRLVDLLLRWSFGVALGLNFVWAFMGHVFVARQVALEIGFPPGNPFQWEVAWAGLALGVLSMISAWRQDFWWPTAIACAVFGWGAAWGHIHQLVVNGNHHEYNSGPILYTDILVPLAVLVLLLVRHRLVAGEERREAPMPATRQAARQEG